jgi:hypothetical protein
MSLFLVFIAFFVEETAAFSPIREGPGRKEAFGHKGTAR